MEFWSSIAMLDKFSATVAGYSATFLTSSTTTTKPLPCSPSLAASIAEFATSLPFSALLNVASETLVTSCTFCDICSADC